MSFEPVLPPYNVTDPTATFLSSSCLDLLLIELVPMAYRVTNELEAASSASNPPPPPPSANPTTSTAPDSATASMVSTALGAPVKSSQAQTPATQRGGVSATMDEEEERDAVFYRLETLGYRVGQGLVERFSRDRPRFNDTLDVIKFICKDLWTLVFRKQVDNLKTNHRGVYVLTDNLFKPFSRMSTAPGVNAVPRAEPFLWFPCGVVRGALAALGINATVQAETTDLPQAIFQIKTVPTKS